MIVANPFSPEVRQNPYPLYSILREHSPVHRVGSGLWLLTSYDHCRQLLLDQRFSHDTFGLPDALPRPLQEFMRTMLLFRDAPDHTRLRTLVHRAFTPAAIEGLRGLVADRVDALLDAAGKDFDLVADFAYPLPMLVICQLMGVPDKDIARFREWTHDLAPLGDPIFERPQINRAAAAAADFIEYFDRLLKARRRQPGDDLISRLIRARDDDDRLTGWELIANAIFLIFAGHETSMNLIGNGVFALLRSPDQLALLRSDPRLIETAVEEFLRYEGPAHLTSRLAREDVDIGGQRIRAGEAVLALLAAGNRDPEHFSEPDRLDITRSENRHLAFSHGIHYCLGAPLARLEAAIAIDAVVRRFPRLELAEEPEWAETVTLRGLKTLKVRT